MTDASLPDELLFGRSGYLLSLLFVRHHVGAEAVPQTAIRQVSLRGLCLHCRVEAKFCRHFSAWG